MPFRAVNFHIIRTKIFNIDPRMPIGRILASSQGPDFVVLKYYFEANTSVPKDIFLKRWVAGAYKFSFFQWHTIKTNILLE